MIGKKMVLVVWIVVISLLIFVGCSKDGNKLKDAINSGQNNGQALKVSINVGEHSNVELAKFVVGVRKGEKVFIENISADQHELVLNGLEAGDWKVSIVAKDHNDFPRFIGMGNATILKGTTSIEVNLDLLKNTSKTNFDFRTESYDPNEPYDISKAWAGLGYDQLIGKTAYTALDLNQVDFAPVVENNANDYYYLTATSTEELTKRLELDQNASSSLSINDKFSASVELKRKIVNETAISENSVVGIYKAKYHKLLWNTGIPYLDQEAIDWMEYAGPEMFRQVFGDKYITSSTIGGEFYAIYKVSSTNITETNKESIAIKAEASLAGIFGGNASSSTSGFSSEEVENYEMSIRLYAAGGVTTFDITEDPEAIRDEYNKFIDNVNNNEYLAVLEWTLGEYPPINGEYPYYDIAQLKLRMEKWLQLEYEFMDLYNSGYEQDIQNEIDLHLVTIKEQIAFCANAELSNSEEPDMDYYNGVIDEIRNSMANAVIGWDDWTDPAAIPGWFGASDQGGGITVGDLNSNGIEDLIVYYIVNPEGENRGYYRIGWDMNNNGDVSDWTDPTGIPGWFGAYDQGGGITVCDINSNGLKDLIVYYIVNPEGENRGYYRIGWDVDTNGDVSDWTEPTAIAGWFGSNDQGGGITVGDLNSNGKLDLIVFHLDNPKGENDGYYRIGWDMSINGDVSDWSDPINVPDWFGSDNQYAGITVGDLNHNGKKELVVFHLDDPDNQKGFYRIGWDMSLNGNSFSWDSPTIIPGSFGNDNQGGGITLGDLNNDGYEELIVFNIDNPGGENRGYYRIGTPELR